MNLYFYFKEDCLFTIYGSYGCPSKGDTVHIDNEKANGFFTVASVTWSHRKILIPGRDPITSNVVEIHLSRSPKP